MYKQMYLILFNAITDCLKTARQGDYDVALGILMLAQQQSEELYISCTAEDM